MNLKDDNFDFANVQRIGDRRLVKSQCLTLTGWSNSPVHLRETDRQAGRQAGRITGRQADRQAGRQAGRITGRQADRQAGRQAGRQTARKTDRQTGRQTGRQTDKDRDRDRETERDSRFPQTLQGKQKTYPMEIRIVRLSPMVQLKESDFD